MTQPLPAPTIERRTADVGEVRGSAKTLAGKARRAGWTVWVTYARGWHHTGRIVDHKRVQELQEVHSVAVRLGMRTAPDGTPAGFRAVACWTTSVTTGKTADPFTGWTWRAPVPPWAGSFYVPIGYRALSALVADPPSPADWPEWSLEDQSCP